MACIKQLIKLAKLLLIAVQFTLSSASDLACDEVCFKGKYCKGIYCITCPNGTFISQESHFLTVCKKWTTMSGPNIIQITPGSESRDVEWGCETGYIKHDINAAEWDCIKAPTTITTTTLITSISTSISTTVKPTMATVLVGSSRELETKYVVTLVVCSAVIIVVIPVGIFLIFKYVRRRQTIAGRFSGVQYQSTSNTFEPSEALGNLFSKVKQVLSEDDFDRFIDHLDDPDGRINRQEDALNTWAIGYPNINHASVIRETLNTIDITFSLNHNVINASTVTDGLNKAYRLNNAFKNFCRDMCDHLGKDAETLATNLELNTQFDIQRATRDFQSAFADCMGKWAFKYPFHVNERVWKPLTIVETELIDLERTDIREMLPTLTHHVYEAMKDYNTQSHQNGATNIV
ncbi:hypothetical protein Bpfe_011145 [Biomphalaria pfeifferi]|uniref:TNFR-Cys domain-containing protein n=1 Tax=Biomphalaria pfeifferi TaxID=112525 RepID=A0AAD8FDF3_BIOPF|nr:hypothetical protein Bpfe_011145 [Biomphalaria pfeifferi]